MVLKIPGIRSRDVRYSRIKCACAYEYCTVRRRYKRSVILAGPDFRLLYPPPDSLKSTFKVRRRMMMLLSYCIALVHLHDASSLRSTNMAKLNVKVKADPRK